MMADYWLVSISWNFLWSTFASDSMLTWYRFISSSIWYADKSWLQMMANYWPVYISWIFLWSTFASDSMSSWYRFISSSIWYVISQGSIWWLTVYSFMLAEYRMCGFILQHMQKQLMADYWLVSVSWNFLWSTFESDSMSTWYRFISSFIWYVD